MTLLLIAVGAVAAAAVAAVIAVLLSARRRGKLAMRVGQIALKSDKVRGAIETKAVQAAADNPELIDQALERMGAGRELKRAAERLKSMTPDQRAAALTAAAHGRPVTVPAVSAARRPAARTRAAAARRQKAKAARRSRKRNRRR